MISSKLGVQNVVLDTIGNKCIPAQNPTKKAYEKKRAAKAITKAAMYRLFGLNSSLNDDYRQAYMCNEYLFQNGQKITSNYCQKKCCTLCNRIKSAQNLMNYGDKILALDDLHLVTLTNKNVYKDGLCDEVDGMYAALKRIRINTSKNYSSLKINGYRTFECTYSWKSGFNPHFHFIVQGKEQSELLVKLWLNQFPKADREAQDIKVVTKTRKSLLEVFKYIAKPITKGYYSASAYDEIMRASKTHRVNEALGCVRGKIKGIDDSTLELDELAPQEITFKGNTVEVWKYVNEMYDYVDPNGELLLGTKLDRKTLNAINVISRSEIETRDHKKSQSRQFYECRGKPGEIAF